jgi:hypothetical protein
MAICRLYGRGGFRTCDLSRVKKNPTSADLGRFPLQIHAIW